MNPSQEPTNELKPGTEDGRLSERHKMAIHFDIRDRLQAVLGKRTYREIGELTGFHAETVRRYMIEGRCSAAFLNQVAELTNTNGDWLLTGRGLPQLDKPAREMSMSELLVFLTRAQRSIEDELARLAEATGRLDAQLSGPSKPSSQSEPKRSQQPWPLKP